MDRREEIVPAGDCLYFFWERNVGEFLAIVKDTPGDIVEFRAKIAIDKLVGKCCGEVGRNRRVDITSQTVQPWPLPADYWPEQHIVRPLALPVHCLPCLYNQ